MQNTNYRVRGALVKFLAQPDLEFFITVTLKRGLRNEAGSVTQLRDEDIEKTARLLQLWFEDKLLGKRRRKGHRLTFISSFERGTYDGNPHLHLAIANPTGLSMNAYEAAFLAQARKLDWIHSDIDIRAITNDIRGDRKGIALYCLKQGMDALLLNATYIPRYEQGSVALN